MSGVFQQPEYLHLLANPFVTHALPVGALALVVAIFLRSRPALTVALIVVLVSAAAIIPTVRLGHAGADRIQAVADMTGGQWLAIHQYRAEKFTWAFLVTAALSAASLASLWKWPKVARLLSAATLGAALAATALSACIAWPAGKIRHRELRDAPPPAAELQRAESAEKDARRPAGDRSR